MTPLVDVMLVLLIIFMVITPMLQKGVSVDMARVNNPRAMQAADKEDATVLAITRDGKIYLGSDTIAWTRLPPRLKTGSRTSSIRPFTSRAMPGPSMVMWSRSWTRCGRQGWTRSGYLAEKVQSSNGSAAAA